MIYIFDIEIELAEKGEIDPGPAALRMKQLQIGAVQTVLDNFRDDERIPAYKLDLLAASIEQVTERLEALAQM